MKKIIIQSLVPISAICLLIYKFYLTSLGDNATTLQNNIWWIGIIILGSMITGFLFEPLTKLSFPKEDDLRVKENPELRLEDHEVMTGHYGFAALTVLIASFIISPILYGRQIILEIQSWNCIWAILTTGCLNVGIFYFFIKAVRYGDISQVTMIRGLPILLTLPISYFVYYFVASSGAVSPPYITLFGFLGMILVLGGIITNVLAKGSKKRPVEISSLANKDWFARHPVMSAVVSMSIASVAVNFDKVAVDSANPFLLGVAGLLIIATITFFWVLTKKGWKRIKFLFQNYLPNFIKVGIVYGLIIVCMNIGLYGNNVNYIVAAKSSTVVFAAFYGIFVLNEGLKLRHKIIRLATGLFIFGGIAIITFYG